ncbi:GNAT family N-acetyltransferase [Flavobacterium sp.]|uniref:GNAT family N-acetyltransferase n=1 Tax=Flavobacterium sp. TaxID=239 RepID=UPI0037BFBCA7
MKNYTVRLYQKNDFEAWNAFIGKAKNATFLFHRNFMEYHNDRFQDYSLIIEDDKKWIAVLPANRVDNQVFSHQGLTYGGLIYDTKLKLTAVLEVFRTVLIFLESQNCSKLQIKLVPPFYSDVAAEELNYALFLAEAKLIRRDTCAVINLQRNYTISKDRLRGVAKGKKFSLEVREEPNFELFWKEVLIPNLAENHQAKPVHSWEEIAQLHHYFPNNIRQFNVYHNNKIVAGTTIFESKNVAHSQYISGNSDKNTLGSVDYLHDFLLNTVFKEKKFFDFGISNEDQGKNLNEGLCYWKESFGANIAVHDFYEVSTANYSLLENVLV